MNDDDKNVIHTVIAFDFVTFMKSLLSLFFVQCLSNFFFHLQSLNFLLCIIKLKIDLIRVCVTDIHLRVHFIANINKPEKRNWTHADTCKHIKQQK